MARGSSSKSASSATAKDPPPGVDKNSKQGFAITFIHLGRRGYQITLWASTWTARKKWLEKIEERQNELRERSLVFETVPLSAGYFVGTNRLTCAAPFGENSLSLVVLILTELTLPSECAHRQRESNGLRYRERSLSRRSTRQGKSSRQGHFRSERHSTRCSRRTRDPHRSRR